MKKPRVSVLVVLTAVFAAFTLGFLLGRNHNRGTLMLSIPASMQTAPAETAAPTQGTEEETEPVRFPLNINTASAGELQALPGIGEVLAGRILAYREENGGFSAVEELMNVEGIGQRRMEEILDYITTGG